MQSFAELAVIAFSSAQALREVRARTEELAARNTEFAEQIDHQAATIDVLKAMSASPGDPQPVFDLIVERARELCGSTSAGIVEYDGALLHYRARSRLDSRQNPEAANAYLRQFPMAPDPARLIGQAALERRIIQVTDAASATALPQTARDMGTQSAIVVPLLRDGSAIGVFTATKSETGGFSDTQVALLQTFAEQAVIAIGSAATFRALQDRTAELQQSLEYQAATIDVLKVMSVLTGDPQPVFETIVSQAMRLCGCMFGALTEFDGRLLHSRVTIWFGTENIAAYRQQFPMAPTRATGPGRAVLERRMEHVRDIHADPEVTAVARALGHRSQINLPLFRGDTVIGVITVAHQEVDAFTPAHIALLKTFAEQAVIAIGGAANYRALETRTADLQERTAELIRSVGELQALEETMRAINASLDRETVLATIIARAVSLGEAAEGTIYEYDAAEDVFLPRASAGMAEERIAALRDRRIRMGETHVGRSALLRAPVAVTDVQNDPTVPEAATVLAGIHAVLAVPLLREDRVVGGLVIRRRREGAFAPSTVTLMQTFAAQSVLAIENARLFDEIQSRTRELTEALEMQSATSDVLRAISRGGFDLASVLTALIETACKLCGTRHGQIFRRDGDSFVYAASVMDLSPEYLEIEKHERIHPGHGTLIGRVAMKSATVQIGDAWSDPDYSEKASARIGGVRSMLGVPLFRDGQVIGAFALARTEVRPFTPRQVDLVTNFAEQAVIAFENARLFDEIQARTRELTQSLDDLRRTQDRLIQTEKLASLGALTAGIAHEIKNPLNFVNNFSALSVELLDELSEIIEPAPLTDVMREEVAELTTMLKSNLEKVVSHGKRADGIVKNMLLHSRESGGERREVDFNATVEEALNLAYHGARAEKPGFNITLARDYDPTLGAVTLYPQEFTRVLLNLIGNGFYAAAKRKAEGPDGFEPTLTVSTEARPDAVVVRVRDNGVGMPEAVKAKIFEPFFTTKPAGEGTGLGLSLSHDIIVKQHNGSIAVESREGAFTEFTVTLPRTGAGATA